MGQLDVGEFLGVLELETQRLVVVTLVNNPYQYTDWKGGRAVVEATDLDPTEIGTD